MDDLNATLMEFTTDPVEIEVIQSQTEAMQVSQASNENVLNNEGKHSPSEFYKLLGDMIRHYQSVVIFGPTKAKLELYNLLKDDHRFENIKIKIMAASKMTRDQQHAFVKDYFARQ